MTETNFCHFKKKFVDLWDLEQSQGSEFSFLYARLSLEAL